MAARKAAQGGAAAPPVAEELPTDDAEADPNEEFVDSVAADQREKTTLLSLPRGPGRPVVGQVLSVLSEPHLKQELRQSFTSASDGELDPIRAHQQFRQSLQSELRTLEAQSKKKKAEAKRRLQTERFKESARLGHEKFLENARLGKQRPPWTYTDAGGFLEPPLYEQGESLQNTKNELLCGIYNVQHPDFKPPHHECNVYGGWTYHQTNIRNEMLYEFRDKERQGTPMSPGEKMFKERLDTEVERAMALTRQDALDKTNGAKKKQLLVENAGEHSSLRREKPAWTTQSISTHTYFEDPKSMTFKPRCPRGHRLERLGKAETDGWTCGGSKEVGGCKMGITGCNGPAGVIRYGCKKCKYDLCQKCFEQPLDEYDTGLKQFVEQPERATNYAKNIMTAAANSVSKSFWRPPANGLTGSNRRYVMAQELLHRNTRGCFGLRPSAAVTKRPILLKGTGALSFTHFKDALQEPTFERMSPGDRSGPA